MNESDLVKSLQTGDLLFFDSSSVEGFFIRLSDFCLWNHVALVVRLPSEDSPAYIWEATSSILPTDFPVKDYFNPEKRSGVLTTHLQSRLDCFYGGKCNPCATNRYNNIFNPQNNIFGVSRLTGGTSSCRDAIRQFVQKEHEKLYEENWFPVFKSWWDGWNTCIPCCVGSMNDNDTSRYFCSELIAETLFQSGILQKRKLWCSRRGYEEEPSSEITVHDLQNTKEMNQRTIFGIHYSKVEKFCL